MSSRHLPSVPPDEVCFFLGCLDFTKPREFTSDMTGISETKRYIVQPVALSRPAQGTGVQNVRCSKCGQPIEILVRSPAVTRRRRVVYGSIVIAALVFVLLNLATHLLPVGYGWGILAALIAIGGAWEALDPEGNSAVEAHRAGISHKVFLKDPRQG